MTPYRFRSLVLFMTVFVILSLQLVATTVDASGTCLGSNQPCYDGQCCPGLKCYYAQPEIGLKGFCEPHRRKLPETSLEHDIVTINTPNLRKKGESLETK